MYSTCLFCHASLGANETVEHFPVGRRLAFDAAKGRLWVVCTRCLRWNLTPLEERWEAIEECERTFRETRLRVSTDNIGMARVREGLELVRIGPALRPEIAVWRYGAVNRSRRRRAIAAGAVAGAAGVAAFIAGPATGIGVGYISWQLARASYEWMGALLKGRLRRIRVATDEGLLRIRHEQATKARLVTTADRGWQVRIPHDRGIAEIDGMAALRPLGVLLAAVNADGVEHRTVLLGERILADAGDAPTLLWRLARVDRPFPNPSSRFHLLPRNEPEDRFGLAAIAEGHRVALEMAVNEENERRAMEGELALLEAAWKEAEEIAAIADDLLLPEGVRGTIDRLRGGRDARERDASG